MHPRKPRLLAPHPLQINIEPAQYQHHKHVHLAARRKPPRTVGRGAAKRPIASGARKVLIVQEARGVGAKDARVEVQLPVRHEQLAAGAEQFAADGGFGGDDARADGRVGEAQEFVVERGEQRAVLEQVRHVEAAGGVEGGLDLGLDGAEGGVV